MKSKAEHWNDWHPEHPAILGINELIDRVNERGYDLNASTMRYWQRVGLLPRPIKAGGNVAYYPQIAVDYVIAIRDWHKIPALDQCKAHIQSVKESNERITFEEQMRTVTTIAVMDIDALDAFVAQQGTSL